jgi:hypothetical protein
MPLKHVSSKIEIIKTTSIVVFIQCNKVISEEVIEVELSTWRGLFAYNQSSHSLEASKSIMLRFHEGGAKGHTLITLALFCLYLTN